MEIVCPIDAKFANEIAALLKPPPSHEVQEHFDNLIAARQCRGLKVKQNTKLGKGVYAESNFNEGDLVLKDQMLVGAQHSSNKIDCLVCSFCFRFIGSIELQVSRRLYLQNLGVLANNECHKQTSSHVQEEYCEDYSLDDEKNSKAEDYSLHGECSISGSKNDSLQEVVQSLMNGGLKLPHSGRFPLPSVFNCPGGCREAYYCCESCAKADWDSFHSLLCTGQKSESFNREALQEFIRHADETNDIFHVAAKVIAFTILRYRKLKADNVDKKGNFVNDTCNQNLLFQAWKPVSMGYKKRWWECVALPDDVDCKDEAAFRMQIKELAFTSLQLLKAAMFDKECELLFSLEIYGHIIGMFELNNLDLVVASPVEDYFLYIDDLPLSEKNEAEVLTRVILDALGDDYSEPCQGTAFFPIQSCMNHSCLPNAKAFKRDEDKDGHAIILALGPIAREEEVTISYIDEELPVEERQMLLKDYGFRCSCPKCVDEEEDP
ncbi:histone-lysine N-methyltransferase ATXR2 [Impatiens glandulifera]|uniref:histone-lysine N-methyltransferase ATXR2 n=1 Tax=Impatiens glandulifera TaxID=253017 RepID=UPI001FB19191|nr:histone-lysine N-methyltransferase ATXR2 [Impatiens glandulifera]